MSNEISKKWYNPLALAIVLILVGVMVPPIVIEYTTELTYVMKILIRVPVFLVAFMGLLVAGASLAEFSYRVRSVL
jgi:hypothetical protein